MESKYTLLGGVGETKSQNFFPKAVKLSKLNRRKEMIDK